MTQAQQFLRLEYVTIKTVLPQLTKIEAIVYLSARALEWKGGYNGNEVAQFCGLDRSDVYAALRALREKGIIQTQVGETPTSKRANHPLKSRRNAHFEVGDSPTVKWADRPHPLLIDRSVDTKLDLPPVPLTTDLEGTTGGRAVGVISISDDVVGKVTGLFPDVSPVYVRRQLENWSLNAANELGSPPTEQELVAFARWAKTTPCLNSATHRLGASMTRLTLWVKARRECVKATIGSAVTRQNDAPRSVATVDPGTGAATLLAHLAAQ